MATPDPDREDFRETLAPTSPVRTYRSEVVAERPTVLEQIIRGAAIILDVLLAIRFVLALFGANPGNSFVSFIFSATNWLVAPFRTVFGTPATGTGGYFDWAALIAIVAISLIAALLIGLTRPRRETF